MSDIQNLVKVTMAHNIRLQARVDALTALVTLLARNAGAAPEAVNKTLRNVEAAALQKRLEAVENQSPELAAEIDPRGDMPDIDLSLLERLKFDEDGQSS